MKVNLRIQEAARAPVSRKFTSMCRTQANHSVHVQSPICQSTGWGKQTCMSACDSIQFPCIFFLEGLGVRVKGLGCRGLGFRV